jgi:hypothetical protein
MPTTATAAYFVLRDRKAVARRVTIVFVVFMIQFLSGSMENRRAASIRDATTVARFSVFETGTRGNRGALPSNARHK